MSLVRIAATVGLSLAAAVGLGVAFQPEAPGEALRPAPAPEAAAPASASLYARPSLTTSLTTPAPEVSAAAVPTIAALTDVAQAPALRTVPDPMASARDSGAVDASEVSGCQLRAEVTAQPAAMMALTVMAPCDAGEPIAISHGALLLAEPVGADGRLELALPALAREAVVTLATLDGRVVTAGAQVPDFDLFQRVVVVWDGAAVLDLHAFAGGAVWDEPGHVRAGGPVSAATGFVLAYGDPEIDGPQARVYTYPVGIAATSGHVTVEAQVAVVPPVCGREFVAEVVAHVGAYPLIRRGIAVPVPACGGSAGMVLLPDLIPMTTAPDLAALD
jgi:hypothetical protein